MGYEKEKRIERQDNSRKLASSLRENRKVEIDLATGTRNDESRLEVWDVLHDLIVAIADGEVDYITVGRSRDRGAVLLTVTDARGVKSYAGGHNWDKLAREAAELFELD